MTKGVRVRIGAFEVRGGVLSGPRAYMDDRGDEKLDAILDGRDVGFNAGLAAEPLRRSTDEEIARRVLVHLQTDYAGWRGARAPARRLGGGREPATKEAPAPDAEL